VWQPTADNKRFAYAPLEEVDDAKMQELETETPEAQRATASPDAAEESS